MENARLHTQKLVTLAIFTALIIVLQLTANVAKIGPVSITLSLVPIVVGAALYGTGAGAYLGGVFGLVVLMCCISGMDLEFQSLGDRPGLPGQGDRRRGLRGRGIPRPLQGRQLHSRRPLRRSGLPRGQYRPFLSGHDPFLP